MFPECVQVASKHAKELPKDLDYSTINTMSKESREKLNKFRPLNLGQATRIGGVSPADITALMLHLSILHRRSEKTQPARAASQEKN
jgi:tRNA uridine 5-carboxymethylaminomethyl modification enzyme